MRDFTYDPKAIAQEKHEKSKLEMQLKKQFVSCLIVCCLHLAPWPSYTGSTDELAESEL